MTSPHEYVELIIMALDSGGFHATNFTATLFAYLLMTYLIGAKLTRVQVWAISAIYSIYLVMPGLATYQSSHLAVKLRSAFSEDHPGEFLGLYDPIAGGETILHIPLIFGLAWITSLGFMIHSRRNK